ncbi:MAG: hypothetical protein OXC09_00380 [Truepera sp.]|nr:hypothetical protein [Truepera sp.]
MAEYIIAFDDSGGSGRLVDGLGRPMTKGSFRPFPTIAGAMIRKDQYELFCEQWQKLCSDIGRDLGVASAPIHARLMYGRVLPPDRNPYAESDGTPKLDFNKTVEYLSRAVELFGDFSSQARVATTLTITAARSDLGEGLVRYYQDPEFYAEMMFLRENSEGRYKRMYQRYQAKSTSALLALWIQLVATFEQFAHVMRLSSADFVVDSFQDSAGIDSDEFLEYAKEIIQLEYIGSGKIASDPNNEPLLQFADLWAYITRRHKEAAERVIGTDQVVEALYKKYNKMASIGFPREKMKGLKAGLYMRRPDWIPRAVALQYALARKEIEDLNPDFANRYLLSVEEFLHRALDRYRQGRGEQIVGYSILEASALQNGGDPARCGAP